jgi:hypothetical protein
MWTHYHQALAHKKLYAASIVKSTSGTRKSRLVDHAAMRDRAVALTHGDDLIADDRKEVQSMRATRKKKYSMGA